MSIAMHGEIIPKTAVFRIKCTVTKRGGSPFRVTLDFFRPLLPRVRGRGFLREGGFPFPVLMIPNSSLTFVKHHLIEVGTDGIGLFASSVRGGFMPDDHPAVEFKP